MAYEYKIGSTLGGMSLLTSLGIRAAPQAGYRQYATVLKLGDNTQKGQGFPIITWHWAFVSLAERAVFMAFLSAGALSATVFIRSRLPNNTFANYQCKMQVPTGEENLSVGKILDFTLVFTGCVLIP